MHPIQTMIERYHAGQHAGIYSCCCANELVIRAVMQQALRCGSEVLIEATANQVNQDGGYTGMTPADFVDYVRRIAQSVGFPMERVILGGDHLGPLTWTSLPEHEAMEHARVLVAAYAGAGFTKIHIDTSMKVASDDPDTRLSDAVIARRGAALCAASEAAYAVYQKTHPQAQKPVYVIGSEVPIPGGTQEQETMQITSPADCESTIKTFFSAFEAAELTDVWQRVVGVVVQPGVEYGSHDVVQYDRELAKPLHTVLERHPQLCFEAHSTDYQTREHLHQLVEDGFLILKVGPALTFALREALLTLDRIDAEIYPDAPSGYRAALEKTMAEKPGQWKKYYHGSAAEQRFDCIYSLSDRQRYYSAEPAVHDALEHMLGRLRETAIPEALLSQYMPLQFKKVRAGTLKNEVDALITDYIEQCCIADYAYAARG